MACNYNQVILAGRLTKEPEFKQISTTSCKTTFFLAVTRSYKNGEGLQETDFIPITLWGRLAEYSLRLLRKGSPILLWGKLKIRNYEKDEQRKWVTEVIGENFQVLERLVPTPSIQSTDIVATDTDKKAA